jgi:hypothetical protein
MPLKYTQRVSGRSQKKNEKGRREVEFRSKNE